MFNIINAARTPGIHPAKVNRNTINIEPQPLSSTAKGGRKIDKITRQKLMKSILVDLAKVCIQFLNNKLQLRKEKRRGEKREERGVYVVRP